jgi:predicted nucleic acid-binding protein
MMVVAETTYLVGTRLGPRPEARFLAALDEVDIIAPAADDWKRIAELVERYKTFPLGGVDASVIVLAERLDTDLVLTFDHRHMATVKPRHCAALRLLP